jgi:murein DD-endopeptidase MepM/ murein hydrolase activator NlpD
MMRHIISPYEYIIYNAPVHAVADAEVVEVVMDRPDDIHETKNLNFGSVDVEEHLGNIIRLRINKVVDVTYGGLQKNSSKLQVGDIVKRGDFIARVGASAWSKVPFLYLGLSYIGPRIPIAGNLAKPFEMEKLAFLPHMQCDLVDLRRLGSTSSAGKDPYAIFTHIDPMAIEYKPMVKWLTQCCLIKKFPTILSP